MKQLCTLKVLLVALWCLSVSVKSYAEVYSGSCGESVNWSLDTEIGLLEITGSGEMEDYYGVDGTPWYLHRSSINKCTIENGVTSIGDNAFSYYTGLTSITIGNSVTSIGEYAFSCCTGLTSITIPNSVTSIGYDAFYGCRGLTSITIGNSVTSIGVYAFKNCTGLTSITIPESVTSIGHGTFFGCTGLKSITIPESVTSIVDFAFTNCTGLTSITIPESVTSIGYYAFKGCGNLKAVINLSNLNITEGSVDNGYVAYYADKVIKPDTQIDDFFFEDRTDGNYLIYYIGNETELTLPENYQGGSYGIGEYAFSACTGLTSITIGNSVTSIGDAAFKGCTTLRIITLPENVKGIGHNAFSGCTKMRQIYCRSQEPPVCGNSALNGIDTNNCTLFVPEGAEALYKAADQWKEFFFIEEITGIDTPKADDGKDTTYDIYDMSGRTVRKAATTTDGLKPGLYIINGRKVLVE